MLSACMTSSTNKTVTNALYCGKWTERGKLRHLLEQRLLQVNGSIRIKNENYLPLQFIKTILCRNTSETECQVNLALPPVVPDGVLHSLHLLSVWQVLRIISHAKGLDVQRHGHERESWSCGFREDLCNSHFLQVTFISSLGKHTG